MLYLKLRPDALHQPLLSSFSQFVTRGTQFCFYHPSPPTLRDQLPIAGEMSSPEWQTTLWCQSFLDCLFSPANTDATPWAWLQAVCSSFCNSFDALSSFPPQRRPTAGQPRAPLSWQDIVRGLRQGSGDGVSTRTRSLKGTKPSHARMVFCEAETTVRGDAGACVRMCV